MNSKVILVVGGGDSARKYINAAKKFNVKSKDADWIGIMATRINAELVRAVFNSDEVIYDPTKIIKSNKKIIIAAGYKPGWSSDYVAAMLAKKIKADYLLNLSNIYHVYNKNPSKFKDAIAYDKLSWKEMQKIVGTKWTPGLNVPFDPIATKLCKLNKMKVIITKGTDIINLKKLLQEKKAKCTVIE